MAFKKVIKRSEARILVFLNNTSVDLHYASAMSARLDMEYNYIMRILANMVKKNWIARVTQENKVFYGICDIAPLNDAVEVLADLSQSKLTIPS